MYLNTKKHYLSYSICISAVLGLTSQMLNALIRIIYNRGSNVPDMLNDVVYNVSFILQLIVIAVTLYIFYRNISLLKKAMDVVDEDDADEMALLQKQYNPKGISTLRAETIYGLLEIWAVIMTFTQIISIVSNNQYKSFVDDLYGIVNVDNYEDALTFAAIYNSTHGFKYIGMFSAIIIGIFVTAVFLKDRLLKLASIGITVFFLLSFSIFQMVTFYTSIKIVSIVWTSVIYHGLETVGLIVFSIYLTRHYKGL